MEQEEKVKGRSKEKSYNLWARKGAKRKEEKSDGKKKRKKKEKREERREGGEGHVTQTRSFHSCLLIVFLASHKNVGEKWSEILFCSLVSWWFSRNISCSPFLQTFSHSHFLLAQTFLPLSNNCCDFMFAVCPKLQYMKHKPEFLFLSLSFFSPFASPFFRFNSRPLFSANDTLVQ